MKFWKEEHRKERHLQLEAETPIDEPVPRKTEPAYKTD
jgi:hypothetical protein